MIKEYQYIIANCVAVSVTNPSQNPKQVRVGISNPSFIRGFLAGWREIDKKWPRIWEVLCNDCFVSAKLIRVLRRIDLIFNHNYKTWLIAYDKQINILPFAPNLDAPELRAIQLNR